MNRSRWFSGAGLALTVLLLTGVACSQGQRSEDFIPREEAARAALEAYLRAWSRGDAVDPVPGTDPPVMAVDDLRAKGRTLKGYNILGPVPSDAALCFAVRLTLGNPPEEVRDRYVVVGLDPLWVWRYDDYLMITHWDHPMPAGEDASRPTKR